MKLKILLIAFLLCLTSLSLAGWDDDTTAGGFVSPATENLDMDGYAIENINWATSDDGAGSGLDADLLDSHDSNYFLPASSATATYLSKSSATATYYNEIGDIQDADDDSATKGVCTFDNTDFNAAAGVVTIVDDGHAHTGTSISGLDISDDTNLVAGTNITLVDDTLNVDDAFIKNSEGDTINGTLTSNFGIAGATGTFSGQVTSNGNNLIDEYDYAVCISTPNAFGVVATLVSPFRNFDVTISSISAQIIGGTNVVLMIEQRTIAGVESAGTDIWAGDVTVLPTNWIGGTVSDFTVPAGSALVLKPTSVSGDVDRLMIKYKITRD